MVNSGVAELMNHGLDSVMVRLVSVGTVLSITIGSVTAQGSEAMAARTKRQ